MLVIVVYDIDMKKGKDDSKRLKKISGICERYGMRVQNSVFEMIVDNTQYLTVKNLISSVIDQARDCVRYYIMGNKWSGKVECAGVTAKKNADEVLIF